MTLYRRLLPLLAVIFTATAQADGNNWIDAISLTYGEDMDDNETTLYRLGLQNKWERTWLNDGAWYIGGYWDAELAYMEKAVVEVGHIPTAQAVLVVEMARNMAELYGATDDYGYHVVDSPATVYDLWATVLYQLGIEHTALTYRFGGRDFRLTDVHGFVVPELLA